ncbi:MFS transporter [Actinoallomurus rhizosphaericola]|uniref:MFS transporter n=1 Tax=Actinoallomurus rhizosphaericola TaxID=2952536 RepID=UPI0020910615|nr:MFS transporter [Actinoallomurus rhizosphaericola]MCO5991960.1 MFS transporter [Actinoallomurus rhizosphaericola]
MTSRVLVRARLGTVLTFALAGMLCGVWVSRTPALADKFGMSEGDVGTAILVWGIGAIIAMQGLRGVMARLGGTAVLRIAAPLTAVSVALIGLAPTRPLLFAAVALFGMTFGLTDIGMNAQGSAVERSYGRPIMNGMHAGWCAGAISGGLIGSFSASAGLSFGETLVGGAIIALAPIIVVGRTYIDDRAPASAGRGRARLPLVVYLIGALAFVAFMMEGTIADWSGLFLNRELGATQSVAALAYPLFEAAMLAGRLVGDRVRARLGTRRLLTYAGLGTAVAVSVVVLAPATPFALVGFGLAGLMVCTVVPTTISVAGSIVPGRSAAAVGQVSAIGYGGLVLGPVVIGFLADAASLRVGLGLAVVLALLIAASARFVPARRLMILAAEPEPDVEPEPVRLAA